MYVLQVLPPHLSSTETRSPHARATYVCINNSPLHVGISLRSALKGTLSGSLNGTLADESWKSPLIEDKKYNKYILDAAT